MFSKSFVEDLLHDVKDEISFSYNDKIGFWTRNSTVTRVAVLTWTYIVQHEFSVILFSIRIDQSESDFSVHLIVCLCREKCFVSTDIFDIKRATFN